MDSNQKIVLRYMDATKAGALYVNANGFKGWAFKEDIRTDAKLAEVIARASVKSISLAQPAESFFGCYACYFGVFDHCQCRTS